MRKPIYDPKKKAIPCKFGGYRRLCDMTPTQLAEEGYDEMGDPLPKVEPAGGAIDRFVGDGVVRVYNREFRVKTRNGILNEIYQSGLYDETVNKTNADFNKLRQLRNCESCGYARPGQHVFTCIHPDVAYSSDVVAMWLREHNPFQSKDADNCPGWKEKK